MPRPLYRRALEIWEAALGTDHPDLGKGTRNLGYLFLDQKKYAGAEKLFRRSLEILRRSLGEDNEETVSARHDLETALRAQGRRTEARGPSSNRGECSRLVRWDRYSGLHPVTSPFSAAGPESAAPTAADRRLTRGSTRTPECDPGPRVVTAGSR